MKIFFIILAAALHAITAGIAVDAVTNKKVGLKYVVSALILSGIVAIIFYLAVWELFALKEHTESIMELRESIASVFSAFGLMGTLHLAIVYQDEKVKK